MQSKNKNAVTENIGESLETAALPTQPQPHTASGGTAGETTSAAAGEGATTTKARSITAAHTQVNTPSPADAPSQALTPAFGTIVPNANKFTFTETDYEPTDGLTVEEMIMLSDNDLLTGCKKQFAITATSFKSFKRDLETLVMFFDAIVERFKDQGHNGAARQGRPTLPGAFFAIGWNYEAARKMKQRFLAAKDPIPTYAPTPMPLQLTEGDLVMEQGKDVVFTVVNVHAPSPANTPTVDIVPKEDDKAKPRTITTESLKKVTVPIKQVEVGNLILCNDTGAEYRYEGHGKFVRTDTKTLQEQKRDRELATIKANRDREAAKTAEKARQKELRKAEAARRDLDKIVEKQRRSAEAKAKKDAKVKKQAEAKAAKAKSAGNKPSANKVANEELTKVARIGDTGEFGVFPESCNQYSAANALTIGTQQVCEAERDRIIAKRNAMHDSPEDVVGTARAVAPQTRTNNAVAISAVCETIVLSCASA
jgi:hypothetical protein